MRLAEGGKPETFQRLHNAVTLSYRLLRCGGWAPYLSRGAALERARLVWRVSGPGAQCGFPSLELLPAVAVVLAGCHQGGFPRPREHRRAIRPGGAQPVAGDEAPERG